MWWCFSKYCDEDFQNILRRIFETLFRRFLKHCDDNFGNIAMQIFETLWWELFGLSEDRCSGLSGSEAAKHHQSSPQLFLSINNIIMIIFFFFLSINKIMIHDNHYIDDYHYHYIDDYHCDLSKYYKPLLTSTLSRHQQNHDRY